MLRTDFCKNIKNDFQEEKQGIQTGGMNGN